MCPRARWAPNPRLWRDPGHGCRVEGIGRSDPAAEPMWRLTLACQQRTRPVYVFNCKGSALWHIRPTSGTPMPAPPLPVRWAVRQSSPACSPSWRPVSVLTLGVLAADPVQREVFAQQGTDAVSSVSRDQLPVSRSGSRTTSADLSDVTKAPREAGLMSRSAVRTAIKGATDKGHDGRTEPVVRLSEKAESAPASLSPTLKGRRSRPLRHQGPRRDRPQGRVRRWVTAGYLTDEKPPLAAPHERHVRAWLVRAPTSRRSTGLSARPSRLLRRTAPSWRRLRRLRPRRRHHGERLAGPAGRQLRPGALRLSSACSS